MNDLNRRLIDAVTQCDQNAVRDCLTQGADLSAKDEKIGRAHV